MVLRSSNIRIFLLLITAAFPLLSWSQVQPGKTQKHPLKPDTIRPLPFKLDSTKRLSERDIQTKKEGFFATGYPRFEYDPIRGVSVGGHLNLFQNKTREDPFFYYTTYRYLLVTKAYIFQNGRIGAFLNYDAPFVFDTRWRLRINSSFRVNPNERYYGIGRQTLDDLNFADKSDGTYGHNTRFRDINRYEDNLERAIWDQAQNIYLTDANYHSFKQTDIMFNVLAERVYYGGRLRYILGYEALFTSFEDYTGQQVTARLPDEDESVQARQRETLINKDRNSETWDRYNLSGFSDDANFTSMIAAAIVWDTRDLEADPGKGTLFEYSHEVSTPWLGSDFNFNKISLQGQYYKTLFSWKENAKRIVFTGSVSGSYIFGDKINFIELFDMSRQTQRNDKLMMLGGEYTLRGFRESRFLAPTVVVANLELRTRLFEFKLWKQDIGLGLSPFYDIGNIWDSPDKINLNEWRGAPGLGLRISWNQSTILRIDYARSHEGSQVFLGSGYIF